MHPTNRLFYTKLAIMLLISSVAGVGCDWKKVQTDGSFTLQPGDLLFQDLDGGPLCEAIQKVTTGYRGADFTHVGIVAKDKAGNLVVLEAISAGVVATPLKTYLGRSLDINQMPKVVVGRLRPEFHYLIPRALKEAEKLKGRPYDKVFAVNNESYYCSELIYEIFLRANDGKPVFKLQPMTFKDPDTGLTFPAWQRYFSDLAVPIPEGGPGINPGGISRSPALTIVHAYSTPSQWQK